MAASPSKAFVLSECSRIALPSILADLKQNDPVVLMRRKVCFGSFTQKT